MRDFKEKFEKHLEEMIKKEHDDYEELKYNDNIYLHTWSADEGEGWFELEVIIPHDEKYKSAENGGCLDEVPGFSSFLRDIKDVLSKKTNKVEEAVNFHYLETFSEGEKASITKLNPPHDVYCGSLVEVE